MKSALNEKYSSTAALSSFHIIKPNLQNTRASINGSDGISYRRIGLNIGIMSRNSDGSLKIIQCRVFNQPIEVETGRGKETFNRCLLPLEMKTKEKKTFHIYFKELKMTEKNFKAYKDCAVYNYVILPLEKYRVDNLPLCYFNKKGEYQLFKSNRPAPKEIGEVQHRINIGGGHLFAAEMSGDVYAAGEVVMSLGNQVVAWNNQSGAYNNNRLEYSEEQKKALEDQQNIFRSQYAIFPLEKFIPNAFIASLLNAKVKNPSPESKTDSPVTPMDNSNNLPHRRISISSDSSSPEIKADQLLTTDEITNSAQIGPIQKRVKLRLFDAVKKVINTTALDKRIEKNQQILADLRQKDLNTPPPQPIQNNIRILKRALSFPFSKLLHEDANPKVPLISPNTPKP